MNAENCDRFVAKLVGFWPAPDITPETTVAWHHVLREIPVADARTLLELLVSNGGTYRPNPAEFYAEWRGYRRNQAIRKTNDRPDRALAPAAGDEVTAPPLAKAKLAELRRTLPTLIRRAP